MSVSPKVVSCPRKGIWHCKEEGKPQYSVFCHTKARWNDKSPPSTRIPLVFLCALLGDQEQALSTREWQDRHRDWVSSLYHKQGISNSCRCPLSHRALNKAGNQGKLVHVASSNT